MNILNRCKKLVSPAFKSRVLLEQTGVYGGVCSISRAQSRRLFPAPLSSCCLHLPTYHLNTGRFYSEIFNQNSGFLQEESQEMNNEGERYSKTFTLDVLVSLLRQENALDICVIKVLEQKYAENFIVVSGISPRHLRAMALYAIKVYKFLKEAKDVDVRLEGKDSEDWMCIDFGKMVVHLMLPDTREKYELEKLWTLRTFDEQLKRMPRETLPKDFIYDAEVTK